MVEQLFQSEIIFNSIPTRLKSSQRLNQYFCFVLNGSINRSCDLRWKVREIIWNKYLPKTKKKNKKNLLFRQFTWKPFPELMLNITKQTCLTCYSIVIRLVYPRNNSIRLESPLRKLKFYSTTDLVSEPAPSSTMQPENLRCLRGTVQIFFRADCYKSSTWLHMILVFTRDLPAKRNMTQGSF